ncbi:MAG: PKD domain-containing protein [Bacteroidales bacterium]
MNLHKTFIPLFAITILLATLSCEKAPETDFSYTPEENPEAGDTIHFQNITADANSYSWTFGDGGTSVAEHPTHIYTEAGIFEVKLTASNDAGDQAKTLSLTIHDPTNLGFYIYISDSTGLILQEGAEVWLYDNQSAWNNIEEPMRFGLTDDQGKVLFKNLEPTVYYIWAIKEGTGGMWVSGGWTPAIVQNETSLFNVECVWFPDPAKSTLRYSDPTELIRREE